MNKNVFLFIALVLLSIQVGFSQRDVQKIGYIDLEYILSQIPEYSVAQGKLDLKVKEWNKNLDKLKKEIETMKVDLNNEKALLTEDLIEDRLEDIAILEEEFKKTEMGYYAVDGDLFFYRKLLVKPIQDQVYNAVQEIGKARRFEIIFDKSSEIIMLYTSEKADISDLVLRSILRTVKTEDRKKELEERKKKTRSTGTAAAATTTRELTPEEQKAVEEREAARKEALSKADKAREDRLKKREEQKAEIERLRQERLKEREELRKQLEENKAKSAEQKAQKELEKENKE